MHARELNSFGSETLLKRYLERLSLCGVVGLHLVDSFVGLDDDVFFLRQTRDRHIESCPVHFTKALQRQSDQQVYIQARSEVCDQLSAAARKRRTDVFGRAVIVAAVISRSYEYSCMIVAQHRSGARNHACTARCVRRVSIP